MLAAHVLVGSDWLVILAVIVGTLLPALYFTRRAGGGLDDFFVSGRSLPWWLAGTSIVATTFGCDTPLAITELVRRSGIFGNWYWWCVAGGHILGVVLLARLWRRSRLVTDVSLIELRYEGRSATALQVFRAGFFGIVYNLVVISFVTRAMLAILSAGVGTPLTGPTARLDLAGWHLAGPEVHVLAVSALMGLAMLYSVFSGLWGVVVSDLLQFGIAMTGAVLLAVYGVNAAGGLHALLANPAVSHGDRLHFVPDLSRPWELPAVAFFVYVGFYWYTDKTADSGGYIAQRLLATKNERHGTLAMMWFVIAHYALRPWPWILAALASVVLLPHAHNIDAYPQMIMTVLPAGLRGLLVASLLAAFISTINTQLNWGASYITRDVYIRLFRPEASQRQMVWVGRAVTVVLMALGMLASYYVTSVVGAWKFLSLLGAGSGLVLVGRWLWWRINAWSELTVLASALFSGVVLRAVLPWVNGYFGWQRTWLLGPDQAIAPLFPLPLSAELLIIVPLCTAAWVTATLLTRPASRARLREFYRRTRPPGPGWRKIAAECGLSQPRGALRAIALAWALGVTFIFCGLFGLGELLIGSTQLAKEALGGAALSAWAFLHAYRWAGDRLAQPEEESAPSPAQAVAAEADSPA